MSQSQIQFRHMGLPDRRDSNLEGGGSTPFQQHQSLGHALNHLGSNPAYGRPSDNFRISTSPSPITSHSVFSVNPAQQSNTSPQLNNKRKHVDGPAPNGQQNTPINPNAKRRRDGDEDGGDHDGSGQGAKHWTDEEKTRLFKWLMDEGQDDHWNALRATKNSCLRECSVQAFGGKKTYQALKGCYERNLNVFRQLYAFETFHGEPSISANVRSLPEADRLREYERRLQAVKKAGEDVGNISARTIDHWHRMGWFELFYRRWHDDPGTGMRRGLPQSNGREESGDEDSRHQLPPPRDNFVDPNNVPINRERSHSNSFSQQQQQPARTRTPPLALPRQTSSTTPQPTHTSHSQSHTPQQSSIFSFPANPTSNPPQSSQPSTPSLPPSSSSSHTQVSSTSSDTSFGNVSLPPNFMSACMAFLQVQTQAGKLKLEHMRRKEEREERESAARMELEVKKAQESESMRKQKIDMAMQLISKPGVDPGLKKAANEYLTRLYTSSND